ncbi:MAG: hypothetical protein BRC25_03485 [Parcubacteria group bacterium SW_6_46_9]|nr:MAG: hypothetical protein BRC25_03485 [Parcubacteria group bacterium SW_6_46_9]
MRFFLVIALAFLAFSGCSKQGGGTSGADEVLVQGCTEKYHVTVQDLPDGDYVMARNGWPKSMPYPYRKEKPKPAGFYRVGGADSSWKQMSMLPKGSQFTGIKKNPENEVNIKFKVRYSEPDQKMEDFGPLGADSSAYNQPNFGIRSKEEIVPGRKYEMIQKKSADIVIRVTKGPYLKEGDWMFDYAILRGPLFLMGDLETDYLSDKGVIPYSSGKWNQSNHMQNME